MEQTETSIDFNQEEMISDALTKLWNLETERTRMVADLQAQIDRLQKQMRSKTSDIDVDINVLEAQIKDMALKHGRSVTCVTGYRAQYNKGRVSWDTKRLDGLSLLIPQINECKSNGEPYVVIVRK